LISWLVLVMLLPSCGLSGSQKELNASSYDPPVITLTDGRLYTFQEVSIVGRGQKYYSQYVWQRALITGQK
jgi:hypothetical protein